MFDMSSIALDKILEIKEWVEGPEPILLLDEASLSLIEEAILKVKPAAITSHSPKVLGEIQHYAAHVEVVSYEEGTISIDDSTYKQVADISTLTSLDEQYGIVISGSDEEEVGVKNFDLLDDILDSLEED